jgi:hypothetical protein
LLPVATLIITSIKKKLSSTSKMKDCIGLPAGNVVPRNSFVGNKYFNKRLAKNAPS